jgi:uncharacterized protein
MKNIPLLLLCCFVLVSCKKKNDTKVDFDRKSMLTNIGNTIIVPSYLTFKTKTEELVIAVEAFNTSPNNTSLSNLQNSWKEAATSWKACETYTFAYAENNTIASKIDSWPTNTSVIESEINGSSTISEAYIGSTGTTRKGFPAIEYLIFNTSGNSVIIDNFTTQPNFSRRAQYLQALAADIKTNATNLYNDWEPNGGNYVAQFISNSSNDVGSSVTILLNAMIQNLEVIKNNKIGIPLGKPTNGTLHPELVEAGLSEMSLSHIKTNLQTLENLYLGSADGSNGQGFDDYLQFVKADYEGQPLADKITEQFTSCHTSINALTNPLSTSITTETANCETAYLELKKLVVLMKLDMSSQLGIIITFSDNDGD